MENMLSDNYSEIATGFRFQRTKPGSKTLLEHSFNWGNYLIKITCRKTTPNLNVSLCRRAEWGGVCGSLNFKNRSIQNPKVKEYVTLTLSRLVELLLIIGIELHRLNYTYKETAKFDSNTAGEVFIRLLFKEEFVRRLIVINNNLKLEWWDQKITDPSYLLDIIQTNITTLHTAFNSPENKGNITMSLNKPVDKEEPVPIEKAALTVHGIQNIDLDNLVLHDNDCRWNIFTNKSKSVVFIRNGKEVESIAATSHINAQYTQTMPGQYLNPLNHIVYPTIMFNDVDMNTKRKIIINRFIDMEVDKFTLSDIIKAI